MFFRSSLFICRYLFPNHRPKNTINVDLRYFLVKTHFFHSKNIQTTFQFFRNSASGSLVTPPRILLPVCLATAPHTFAPNGPQSNVVPSWIRTGRVRFENTMTRRMFCFRRRKKNAGLSQRTSKNISFLMKSRNFNANTRRRTCG